MIWKLYQYWLQFQMRNPNTVDDTGVDVSARGFRTKRRNEFLDIRVFNPLTKIYMQPKPGQIKLPSLKSAHRANEQAKEREYGTLTPLVFSTFGGLGYECNRLIKLLNEMLAEKRNGLTSTTMSVIRAQYNFSLLRTTLLCIIGSRTSKKKVVDLKDVDFNVAKEEANIK